MKEILIGVLHAVAIGICAYQDLNSKSLIGTGLICYILISLYAWDFGSAFFDRGEYIVVKVIGI